MISKSMLGAATFGCGFVCAWLLKPALPVQSAATELSERQNSTLADPTQNAAKISNAFQQLREDEYAEWREELFAKLNPEEIPMLLAVTKERTSLYGPNYNDRDRCEALLEYWYKKAPETALAWLHKLPNTDDQERFLGVFVRSLAATDLKAAINLLRQEATRESGYLSIPETLLDKAPDFGADAFVEFCRAGLSEIGVSSGANVFYPDDFEFAKALNGLADAQAAFGEEAWFSTLPINIVSEWANRDWKAAWAWVQKGKTVEFNGAAEFFGSLASSEAVGTKEIGAMIASTLDPAADPEKCYNNAWAALRERPTPQVLDGFLQAAPGSQAAHLDGLFDNSGSALCAEAREKVHVHALILERMTPAQRLKAFERNKVYFLSAESKHAYSPVLRRLGHSEEEIRALWP